MPKGDRLKLKADPEDGTTPVANLLLEAVVMAKLSGLQKGAILYLWRRTYGWTDETGKRKKEDKIPLSEWGRALNSSASRVSTTLTQLEKKGIITRRTADMWGGYYYSMNTDITKWNSDCINLAKLRETVGIPDFGTVTQTGTVVQMVNSSAVGNSYPNGNGTVTQTGTEQLPKRERPTLYKESTKETLKKEGSDFSLPILPLKPTESVKVERLADDQVLVKIIDSDKGKKVKDVFARLDEARGGYRPPKRKAEAASILRMLKNHTPDQIIETWHTIKAEPFWDKKELFMMTVESQIGALIHGTHQHSSQAIGGDQSKYIGGKYGKLVQS